MVQFVQYVVLSIKSLIPFNNNLNRIYGVLYYSACVFLCVQPPEGDMLTSSNSQISQFYICKNSDLPVLKVKYVIFTVSFCPINLKTLIA